MALLPSKSNAASLLVLQHSLSCPHDVNNADKAFASILCKHTVFFITQHNLINVSLDDSLVQVLHQMELRPGLINRPPTMTVLVFEEVYSQKMWCINTSTLVQVNFLSYFMY